MIRRTRARFMVVAVLAVAACAPAPSAAPSGPSSERPAAGESGAPTSPAGQASDPPSSGPPPAPSPGGSANPGAEVVERPTSADLIREALASGRIDAATAVLYRLYAATADPRLPDEYAARWREDNAAYASARRMLPTLSPEKAATLRPFLLRPTEAGSAFASRAAPTAGVGADAGAPPRHGMVRAGAPAPRAGSRPGVGRVLAPLPCVNNWISRRVSPNIPVMVWAPCGAEQGLNNVVNFVAGLWQPMTLHMGDPILDANIENDDYPDCPECGDGLLDIYVTIASQSRGRQIEISDAMGVAVGAPPFVGSPGVQASSAFVIIDYAGHTSLDSLEATVAHELFHVLQYAHNNDGMFNGPAGAEEWHWFLDASAVWAEFHFVPHARDEFPYQLFAEYQSGAVALGSTAQRDPYREWTWPLFLHQERGHASIAAVWTAFEGQTGLLNLQQILDRQLSFASEFRRFAVRLWNQHLLPGNPIPKRFEHLDPDFPGNIPGAPRLRYDETLEVQGETEAPRRYKVAKEPLQVTYARFQVDELVGKIEIDVSGITPADRLDVDLLVKIRDGEWEHRELDEPKTTYCLDIPKDDIETLIVVLSNHDLDLTHAFSGDDWSIKSTAGCGDLVGVLTVKRTYELEQAEPGLPHEEGMEDLTATVTVVMVRDLFGGFEDKRSKFSVGRATSSSRENGDCTAVFTTRSEGTWKFTDFPVGGEWESGISAFADRASKTFFGSMVAHYPLIVGTSTCGGGLNFDDAVHDAWTCDGGVTGTVEVIDGADDIVVIDCRAVLDQSGTYRLERTITTIQGVLTLRDETGP